MPLKRFYALDFNGESLSVAQHLQNEGVDVLVALVPNIRDTETDADGTKKEESEDMKKRMSMFNGMIPKTTPEKLVAKVLKENPDEAFCFCGFNLVHKYGEMLKDSGIPGLYCTEADRELEVDRAAAKQFVLKHYPDLKVAEEHEFKTIKDAIKFLESTDSAWVAKGFDESAPTVVPDSDDPDEARSHLVEKLEGDKKAFEKGGFILEKKIANAIEITPEAMFVDGKMVATTVDLELKRIGAGDIGFMTGCAADLVFETDMGAYINEIAFPKAVHDLAKKHKGVFIWDASILFDPMDNTPYFGEFCANRAGYNAFYTELAQVESCKAFFEALMVGENPFEQKKGNFGASIRVFNFKASDGKITIPEGDLVEFDEDVADDVWLMDVKKDGDRVITLGWDYQLAVVTGCGDNLKDAAKSAYNNLEGFHFPGKIVRPMLDYLSTKYPGSIPNRYKYAVKNNLI